jgi:hypothetical protein
MEELCIVCLEFILEKICINDHIHSQYFNPTNVLQKSIKSIRKVDQVSPSMICLVLH